MTREIQKSFIVSHFILYQVKVLQSTLSWWKNGGDGYPLYFCHTLRTTSVMPIKLACFLIHCQIDLWLCPKLPTKVVNVQKNVILFCYVRIDLVLTI